jgi:gamma-tubulin complex component 4
MYVRALCIGLEELLDGYRQRVLQAEEAVLSDPSLPLTFLPPFLGDHAVVLPYVHRLVRDVQLQQLAGGLLLNHLHEASLCGVPAIHDAVTRCVAALSVSRPADAILSLSFLFCVATGCCTTATARCLRC